MSSTDGDSEEDDALWEQVDLDAPHNSREASVSDVLQTATESSAEAVHEKENEPPPLGSIDIVLKKRETNRRAGVSKAMKELQLALHKAHTFLSLVNAVHRNALCDLVDVQACMLSLLPANLVDSFESPPVSLLPSGSGDDPMLVQFQGKLSDLVRWWHSIFQVSRNSANGDVETDPVTLETLLRSAETREGNSGILVQLFVALCRALQLECRFVTSLQPIPFRHGQAEAVMKARNLHLAKKLPPVATMIQKDQNHAPAPVTRKRKRASPERKSTSASLPTPPIFWAEVLYPQGKRWIPVDVLRGQVNPDGKLMEPSKSQSPFNSLVYAIALQPCSDRVNDVTARYANNMDTVKRSRYDPWFTELLRTVFQKDPSRHPDVEAKEAEWLATRAKSDAIPTSIQAFLNHPRYVLERHLKKYECIYPRDPLLVMGQIRSENIYPRSCVQMLHTADKWLSMEARVIRFGEEPVKLVKSRQQAAKKTGIRDLAKLQEDSDGEQDVNGANSGAEMVGLFGFWQTEAYTPEPVVDGKIPKNKYNNVDLYRPSMLPAGAVHLTDEELTMHIPEIRSVHRGGRLPSLKRIAKTMGIDFAEAVVGFEYHGGRSCPILSGIVVAEEFEHSVRQLYHQKLAELLQKEAEQREKEVLKRWATLIRKALVHQRLKRKFGDHHPSPE